MFVLIETLWNVNTYLGRKTISEAGVLIETLWNVNRESTTSVILRNAVLIETLWNVNQVPVYDTMEGHDLY